MALIAIQPSNRRYNLTQPMVWSNCNVENSHKYRHIFLKHWVNHYGGLYLLQQFFKASSSDPFLPKPFVFNNSTTIFRQRFYPGHSLSNHPWIGADRNQHSPATEWRLPVSIEPPNLPRSHNPTPVSGTFRLQKAYSLPESPRPVPRPISDKADPPSSVIFDLDTKVLTVYGQQQGAKVGFNPKKRGRPSYQPLLCFEGKTGDIWEGSYLSGDIHPAPHTIDVLERSISKLPSGIREIRMRADSAFFDHTIAEYLQGIPAYYGNYCPATKPIQQYFGGLSYEEISPGLWVAEFEYKPWRWNTSQRFIVVRRIVPKNLPGNSRFSRRLDTPIK